MIEREFALWADSPACDLERLDNFYELQQLAFLNWLSPLQEERPCKDRGNAGGGLKGFLVCPLSRTRPHIEYWGNLVARLENLAKRKGRNRIISVVPRDL